MIRADRGVIVSLCARALLHPGLFLVAMAVIFVFGGCKVGPDYHRPEPLGTNAIPLEYSEPASTNAGGWKTAEPSADLPKGAWWKAFADDELNRLEDLSQANNQQLAAAVARFDEARAFFYLARADFFPQVSLTPSYVRQRTSANEPQDGHPARISPTFNTFIMQLQAGWEPDLWGRIRRQAESARDQLDASAADLETVRLTIQAELAIDYFTLRAVDSEYDLVTRTAEAYRKSLELTLNRRKGGVASDLDVTEAQTQLQTTEAALPALRLQRLNLIHALATLCGKPAPSFELKPWRGAAAQPPWVPLGLPSELLERRPDIATAERLMAAANAEIGVAQSAFYPRVQFNGLAGLESVDASTWFTWPSRFWAIGPSVEWPLFTGGRNRARLRLVKARYHETVANYRQVVLSAFQEVEDRLAAQTLLHEQVSAEAAALSAAQHNLEIANNRYKAGLVTYLEVAIAQSAALGIERSVVELQGQRLVAAVGLVKALGGGWEAPPEQRAMSR